MNTHDIKEIYEGLKEINSLSRLKNQKLDEILAQEKRVEHIEGLQSQKKDEKLENSHNLKDLLTQLNDWENELSKLDSRLEKIEINLSQITNDQQLKSLESEKNGLLETKENLENSILEVLEQQDVLSEQIKELEEYIKGSEESIKDIQKETQEVISNLLREVQNYDQRINLLLETCPIQARSTFIKIKTSPFVEYKGDHCPKCGMNLSPGKKEDLLNLRSIISCSGCERIFYL